MHLPRCLAAFHSDTVENAKKEIDLWFGGETKTWTSCAAAWVSE